MKKVVLILIKGYQKTISFFPMRRFFTPCRFFPSCSVYCAQAIEKYGILKGGRYCLGRLFRCHPFSLGGWDPLEGKEREK